MFEPGDDPLRFWELERGPDGQGDPAGGNPDPELEDLRAALLDAGPKTDRIPASAAAAAGLIRAANARAGFHIHIQPGNKCTLGP